MLPVFPLSGALLLPRGRLPLRIFEPRYLNMTNDALGSERMIGMVQPNDPHAGGAHSPLYRTGCAGRITSFSETAEGHLLITLTGVARFGIVEELPLLRGYRRVVADWSPFADDFVEETEPLADRPRLLTGLKSFFKLHGISAEWQAIEQTPDERLVTTLAMICPFDPTEKQALLEAKTLAERAKLMTGLIEMAVINGPAAGDTPMH
jgi:hypothetical protein